MAFFWVGHFDFFCFIPMKISHKLCVRMDGTQFSVLWWFTDKNKSGNHKWAWVYPSNCALSSLYSFFFLQKWYFVTKLFSRTARKNCFSDLENLLKFKVKNLSNFSDHSNNLFKQWKVRTIFGNRMLF